MKTLTGPRGVQLVLDPEQVFPDDPGQGTPAMVHWGRFDATYWCAADCAEVEDIDSGEVVTLPDEILMWLNSPEVVEAVEELGA